MVTESHLPVKKGTKAIYSIIEFIIRATRAFLQGNQKTSSYAALAVCAGQPLVYPPHPSRHPIFGKKPVFLRLESGWGQSDVAQLLTSEC